MRRNVLPDSLETRAQYYRCHSRELGFDCQQAGIPTDMINAQVLQAIFTLKPPADWRNRMIDILAKMTGQQGLEARLAEIRQTIERMDFHFDNGFITNAEEYVEKRLALQKELKNLTPIPDDDLAYAADLVDNFALYFEACDGDTENQNELLKTIINRVYVQGERVVAVELKADMYVVIGREEVELCYGEILVPFVGAEGFGHARVHNCLHPQIRQSVWWIQAQPQKIAGTISSQRPVRKLTRFCFLKLNVFSW